MPGLDVRGVDMAGAPAPSCGSAKPGGAMLWTCPIASMAVILAVTAAAATAAAVGIDVRDAGALAASGGVTA